MNHLINPSHCLISAARFNLALLLLALLATTAQGQIAIQDGTPLAAIASLGAGPIVNKAFTVTPGAKVLVVMLINRQNATIIPEPTTITWNGTNTLTQDTNSLANASNYRSMSMFHLFNPPPGTGNITATYSIAGNSIGIEAFTLNGVDTNTAPIILQANNAGTVTSLTGTASGVLTGSWAAVGSIWGNTGTLTTGGTGGTATMVTGTGIGSSSSTAGYVANLSSGTVTIGVTNGTGTKGVFIAEIFAPGGSFPPTIASQPKNLTVFTNTTVKLTVGAYGSTPLAYQWFINDTTSPLSNGGNLTGTTNSVLTFSNATWANAGNYLVVVTNLYGAATSSVANLTLTSPSGAYESAVMSNAPAPFAYYSFSETSDPSVGGVVAYDSIGAFNGTYGVTSQNGFTSTVGPQATADSLVGFPNGNTALGLNGTTTSAATVPAFNLNNGVGTNVLTITAWIYPNGQQPNAAGIVFCRGGGGSTTAGIAYLDNNPNNYLGYNWANDANNYNWNSGLVPPQNVWSLVALVVTPTNATLYICNTNHGVLSATHVYAHVVQKFDAPTLIGYESFATTRVFNGSIDEVGLFNQALTPSQVSALFSAASGIAVFPVSILTQPLPQSLYGGNNRVAQLKVVAAGSPTITYQWYKGATPLTNGLSVTGSTIAGATNAALTISNVFAGDVGSYYVKVSNLTSSMFSSTNALTIISPIGNAYETALLADSPVAHYELDETGDPSTNNTLAYDYVGGYNGVYGVAAQNGYNGVQGPQPSMGFPGFTSTNLAATFGADANSVITLPPWNLNTNTNTWTGTTLAAWILPNGTEPNGGGIVMTRATGNTCGINYLNFLDANANRIMGYSWNNDSSATWQWNSGLITPQSQWSLVVLTVTPTNATMYVVNTNAFKSAVHVLAHVPMAFNGNEMIGQGNVASAGTAFNGTIDDVAVFNTPLTAAQVLTLFTNASGVTGFPPSITVPPTNYLTAYVGHNVQLQVVAGGTQPLVYQWMAGVPGSGLYTNLFDAGNVTGSTSATLTLSNIDLSQTADYVVVVTNMYGSVTSSVAALTVNDSAPFVVTDITPMNAFYYVGFTATFSATYDGSRPISYQWVTDGGTGTFTNIPNATNSTLVISNLQAGSAGSYYLSANNASGGPVNTSVATLSISPTSPGAYETAVLTNGAVAFYPLDETADPASGSAVAYDYASGYNGTYGTAVQNGNPNYNIQGPRPSSGYPGFPANNFAAKFTNDANSAITLPALNLNTNNWTGTTLAAWVFPNGTEPNGGGILMTRATGNTCGMNYINFLDANNNRIMGYSWNNDSSATWQWNSGLITPQNQWSLLVLTVTPTNATMYVVNTNGFKSAIHVLAHVPMAFNGNEMIGQGNVASAGTAFIGTIDEVALFNCPLTSSQVMELFTAGSGIANFPPPTLSIAPSGGGNLTLTWSAGSLLLQATNLLGPWTTNSTASSPYTVSPTNAMDFFRVQTP